METKRSGKHQTNERSSNVLLNLNFFFLFFTFELQFSIFSKYSIGFYWIFNDILIYKTNRFRRSIHTWFDRWMGRS